MPRADAPASKPCVVCGRSITWRKKWERDWQQVRYCSDGCRARARSSATSDVDAELSRVMLALLDARAGSATICPSEVARAVGGDDWRPLMEPARAAARRLVAAGLAEVTQGGRVVDPSTAKGPIRVRRRR